MQPCVALNGRYTGVTQPTGVQSVAQDLFVHLVEAERPFRLLIFADRRAPRVADWESRGDVEVVHVPFRDWGRSRAQLYEQLHLVGQARRRGADLLYHPINTCPRFGHGLRQVVTLHDLNFHHHPEWYGRAFRTWLEWTTIPGLRKAARVACISEWVAADARRSLDLEPGRVRTIYNGLRALQPANAVPRDPELVLAVNPFQPHKNLVRVVDAVGALREERPGLRLRVAGRPQPNFRSDPELAARLDREYVEVTGYLSDASLAAEYARASVLCMPSFEEGFGMPVIEAMAQGATVVTSDRSCLPEIAGGAAILVDPSSTESIAGGLRQALGESGPERADREAAGRRRAREFDWRRTATAYLRLFGEVLGR